MLKPSLAHGLDIIRVVQTWPWAGAHTTSNNLSPKGSASKIGWGIGSSINPCHSHPWVKAKIMLMCACASIWGLTYLINSPDSPTMLSSGSGMSFLCPGFHTLCWNISVLVCLLHETWIPEASGPGEGRGVSPLSKHFLGSCAQSTPRPWAGAPQYLSSASGIHSPIS